MVTDKKELYHYGMPRRSGRYKWGSGRNPFQRGGKSPAEIKQRQRDELNDLRAKDKARKERTITLTEDDKHFLRDSRNLKTIYKYRDQFSDKELKQIVERANSEKTLASISSNQISSGVAKYNRIIGNILSNKSKGISKTVDTIRGFEKAYRYGLHLAGKDKGRKSK